MEGTNGHQPTRRIPGRPAARLTVSDTLDGPISVAERRNQPADSSPRVRRRQHICLRMLGVWTVLTLLVGLALDSNGRLGQDDWTALAVLLLAGWPVMYVLTRLARRATAPPPPSGGEIPTIILRLGTRVDRALARLLADLAGLDYVEPGSLDANRVS